MCLAELTPASAQLAPQLPQAAYNGQNVSAVSLVANPHRDLTPFYALVSQKVNAPYSEKEIDASAQALKKAGQFPDVQVNVVPDIGGLRLSFLLEPAYYLGIVTFPGAEGQFSYTRLLQTANLSDEDPYDPMRVREGEKSLADFMKKNGFFQGNVHVELDIDDAHELVNVKYNIELGKQAKISSVTIEGTDEPQSNRLLHSMRSLRARLSGGLLKAGKSYSPQRVSAATNLMKRALTEQNRLASSIHENPPQYDASNNRVAVSFKVDVGPIVTVRTVGARLAFLPFLAGRQRRRLIPIYSEGAVDQELVDEGQQNLIDFFQKKGFYDVKVTTDFKKNADEILITYSIDRGEKHRVSSIAFHGNYAISSIGLAAVVTVKRSRIWTHGSLSEHLLKQSANNIEALYHDQGYEKVRATPRTVDRGRRIDVTFDIEEGPQTVVENVAVEGNAQVPYGELTTPRGFQLHAGDPFSARKMTEDRNRISASYLDRGFLNVDVKANVERTADPLRVNVSYAITENQLVRTSQVVYLGQQRTRLSLLKKTAQLPPETPMHRTRLLEAESRLYDLQLFDWASVGPRKPITEQSDEMTLVKVHEAKRTEVTYGLGFEVSHRGGNAPSGTVAIPGGPVIGLNGEQVAPSQSTFASPRGLIEITRRNMRGLAETANASLLLSQLDQRFISTYTQPHFVGSQWQSVTSFSLERNSENPLFTATWGEASFQVERLISPRTNTRVQFRYGYNKTSLSHILVPDLVLPQDQNVRLSTFSATLIKDTRDKPLDAHHGMFATLNLGITPIVLGSSANFTKLVAQYSFYKPVHSLVLANSLRLGLAKPFASSFVPTSELFFSGGGTSLRSFPIDQAGPQRIVPFCNVLQGQSGCVNVTVPVGGPMLFILNSEIRFPLHINRNLGGVVFYDGGNVYSAISLPNFVNNYTNTVGFGLRYATPIGPVRFDIGHNLNPVRGINPTQYYITIGQAF